jgi:iron complex outermembrane receptor protein
MALVVGGQAIAQSTPPATAASDAAAIPDIIVTANRREQKLQKVPIAISAFSQDTLAKAGVLSVADVAQIVPGLTLNRTFAGVVPFIRGIGSTNSGFTTESPVALYIDGFYLPNAASGLFSFNNIERIEVLKGPQGTLFGRNATAGLINVITKKPSFTTEGDISAGYANYDTRTFNAYVSTGLTDRLAVSIALIDTDQRHGWGRNVYTGDQAYLTKETGAEIKALWNADDRTTVTIHGLFDHVNSDLGVAGAIIPGALGNDGTPYLGKFRYSATDDDFLHTNIYNTGAQIEHDLGFGLLRSMTGYHAARTDWHSWVGGFPGNPVKGQGATLLDEYGKSDTITQEVQLLSPKASKFEWLVGGFFLHDNTLLKTGFSQTCIGNVCAPGVPRLVVGNQITTSYAAYAEGTVHLGANTRLTVGGRFTHETKGLPNSYAAPFPGRPNSMATLPAGTVLAPTVPLQISTNQPTWRVTLAHDFSNNIMAYASQNRGFKSGTYNPTSLTNPPTKPEILDASEIGLKSELFDKVLQLNLAAFYYNYRGIQLKSAAPPAPTGTSIVFNAGNAHDKGIDADFVIRPAHGLQINGGLEYLDAKFTKYPGATCTRPVQVGNGVLGGVSGYTCDLAGHYLGNAPKFAFNLGFSYDMVTHLGDFTLSLNDSYKGHFFWDAENRTFQKAYHIVNGAVKWEARSSGLYSTIWVRNLTNTYYEANAYSGNTGIDWYNPGAPRTYGLTVGYKFH